MLENRQMDSADENPYAPHVMLADRPFRERIVARNVWLSRLMILQSLVIILALVAQAYDIESILGSGPIFAVMGLLIGGIGFRTHNHPAAWYGISAVAFALLIVFLINFNEWGPAEAERPVTILSVGYGLVACPVTWWLVYGRTSTVNILDNDGYR